MHGGPRYSARRFVWNKLVDASLPSNPCAVMRRPYRHRPLARCPLDVRLEAVALLNSLTTVARERTACSDGELAPLESISLFCCSIVGRIGERLSLWSVRNANIRIGRLRSNDMCDVIRAAIWKRISLFCYICFRTDSAREDDAQRATVGSAARSAGRIGLMRLDGV